MVAKSFLLLAVSYVSAAVALGNIKLNEGNGNYIIQLNQSTCIKHFVPNFIDGAFKVFSQSLGEHNLEKKNNKIVRRDTNDDQVHIFDAFDLGNVFKGISVKFEHLDLVKTIAKSFHSDIIDIIPDYDIQFIHNPSSRLGKRYYIRTVDTKNNNSTSSSSSSPSSSSPSSSSKPAQRNALFDFDKWEHDKDCPFAPKKTSAQSSFKKQTSAPWNLARISEHKRALTSPYIYNTKAGSDAYVFIIDDGMNIEHTQFGGRAKWGWSAYSGTSRLGEGHGTHVAGIVGSSTYGVAKKANLIAVQVLDETGVGSISSILAGIQWATDEAKKHKGKAIINMSLGMQKSGADSSTMKALNSALSGAVKGGVPIFAAAGNWGNDACDNLPAGNPDVFAVGASDKNDKFASYSSYGKCVNVIAPGSSIKSTYINSKTSTYTMSGTSMASPHVAGVAALLIGDLSSPTPANIYKAIKNYATEDVVKSVSKGTNNALLFNGQKLSSK
ncbi:subtilisin-like protein [Backusella circina FSU 941]|nr:subtilisin-like protein [Backusella circina FSU 941]